MASFADLDRAGSSPPAPSRAPAGAFAADSRVEDRQRVRLHLEESSTPTIGKAVLPVHRPTSAEPWNESCGRSEWAVALAAGGKIDKPIIVRDNHGGEHVVANPGDKLVTNFVMDDSLKGVVFCDPKLPEAASNGNSLTLEQTVQALKGGI